MEDNSEATELCFSNEFSDTTVRSSVQLSDVPSRGIYKSIDEYIQLIIKAKETKTGESGK